MRRIFFWLTLTIFLRMLVEVLFDFKEERDSFFYLMIISRKILNITVMIILGMSIKNVLNSLEQATRAPSAAVQPVVLLSEDKVENAPHKVHISNRINESLEQEEVLMMQKR